MKQLIAIILLLGACGVHKPTVEAPEPVGIECPADNNWAECVIQACINANPTDSGIEYCVEDSPVY